MTAGGTSAIMSVLLNEETSASVKACLADDDLCVSAGTYSEPLVVATGRGLMDEAEELISGMRFEIVPPDGVAAHAAQKAFAKWDKRKHPSTSETVSDTLWRNKETYLFFSWEAIFRKPTWEQVWKRNLSTTTQTNRKQKPTLSFAICSPPATGMARRFVFLMSPTG